jgi:hypothetical protein
MLRNDSFRVQGAEASSPHSRLLRLRFPSLILEQPVKGPPKVMPPMMPVVMPVILVWIVAIWVRAVWVVTILIVATRIIAIGLIAIRVVNIWIGINISHLIPLRVGWNGIRH